MLALEYFNLTGKEPTFSSAVAGGKEDAGTIYGAFLDFVREIFKVLNIQRGAVFYASAAAYKLRGKGRKK